jgi:phosphohistidine phosphatase
MDHEEGRLVILLRHGIAEERVGEKPDEERALTPEGQKKMKSVAKGLAELFDVDRVIASPLVRAVQTALYLAKAAGVKESVVTDARLRPEATPKQIARLIKETEGEVLALVGHEPTLTHAMMGLTGLSGEMELKKAGCYVLREVEEKWELEAILTPRVFRRLLG